VALIKLIAVEAFWPQSAPARAVYVKRWEAKHEAVFCGIFSILSRIPSSPSRIHICQEKVKDVVVFVFNTCIRKKVNYYLCWCI
jgi:hypothetical protein